MRRERERSLKRSGASELNNGCSSSRFADIVDPINPECVDSFGKHLASKPRKELIRGEPVTSLRD